MRDADLELEFRGALFEPGITQCHFIGALLGALGSAGGAILGTAGAVAAPVVSGAAALGSAALSTAGAIGSTALTGIGTLGKAIPAAVGGLSDLAKAAEPAAELFGAGYGVYQSIEQQKMQKRALEIQSKQYPTSAQMSAEALAMRGTSPPIQTLPSLAQPYQASAEDQGEAKREFYMPTETGGDLWVYAALAVLVILLIK